jgi:hypothetical protein
MGLGILHSPPQSYCIPLLRKFGHTEFVTDQLNIEFGQWVTRNGPLGMQQNPPPPLQFWESVALSVPLLAKIAITIYHICPSEACVERSFSQQSSIHTDLRSSLDETSVRAPRRRVCTSKQDATTLMMVRMNAFTLFNVPGLPSAQ